MQNTDYKERIQGEFSVSLDFESQTEVFHELIVPSIQAIRDMLPA